MNHYSHVSLRMRLAALVLAAGLLGTAMAQTDKEVIVSRKALPVAVIKDHGTIQFFVEQYFISEDRIDSMEVFDMNENGFDDKDILKIYPSDRLVNLSQAETALDVMRNWKRTGFIEVIGAKNRYGQIEVREKEFPVAREMHAGLVRMIEEVYQIRGKRLSLFFEFDDVKGIAALKIWGFGDKRALQDTTRAFKFRHDLLFYTRTDTVYVNKPVYDVIYIEQTKRDTVYVKEGE
ncbi:MAG: hypothetical protein ACREOO_31130 [bacterium]